MLSFQPLQFNYKPVGVLYLTASYLCCVVVMDKYFYVISFCLLWHHGCVTHLCCRNTIGLILKHFNYFALCFHLKFNYDEPYLNNFFIFLGFCEVFQKSSNSILFLI